VIYKKTLTELETEHQYSQNKWSREGDAEHTLTDWLSYMEGHMLKAQASGIDVVAVRQHLIKVANLALTAAQIATDTGFPSES